MTIDNSDKFARVLDDKPNLSERPISYEEKRFVQLILLHMTSAFNFSKQSDLVRIDKLKYDFDDFLSLPIPKIVWLQTKHFFNHDFVKFIDNHQYTLTEKTRAVFSRMKKTNYNKKWNILLLSGFSDKIMDTLNIFGDNIIVLEDSSQEITKKYIKKNNIDFIVCFGYGKIIKKEVIEIVPAINVHGGVLPDNKGPNPNLWAWILDCPKGVTIHYIDEGIDTGDIISTMTITDFPADLTLHKSFHILVSACSDFFRSEWSSIRTGKAKRQKQEQQGYRHTFKEQSIFSDLLNDDALDMPLNGLVDLIRKRLKEAKED